MTGRTRELLDLLARHPAGLTAAQVAMATNAKHKTISARLGRMFAYGQVRRHTLAGRDNPTVYLPLETLA